MENFGARSIYKLQNVKKYELRERKKCIDNREEEREISRKRIRWKTCRRRDIKYEKSRG